MKLTFYKQEATPERVDKSEYMNIVGTVDNVILKDDVELLNPTFILRTNPVVYNANYVFCDFTNRYYFVTSFEALTGGRMAVTAEVDVLHTYRDAIKGSEAWVEVCDGAEGDFNMLHNDYPFQADYDIKGIDLSGGDGWDTPFNPSENSDFLKNIFMVIK